MERHGEGKLLCNNVGYRCPCRSRTAPARLPPSRRVSVQTHSLKCQYRKPLLWKYIHFFPHYRREVFNITLLFISFLYFFFLIQFCFRWNCPHLWKILWDWCLESITQVWRKEKVQSCVAGVISSWQRWELRSSCKRKVVSCCPYTNRSPARLCMTVTYGMRPCASRRNQVMRSVQHNGKNRTLLQLNVMLINATSLFFINKIKLNLLHSS